jgi:hypothetical protein
MNTKKKTERKYFPLRDPGQYVYRVSKLKTWFAPAQLVLKSDAFDFPEVKA